MADNGRQILVTGAGGGIGGATADGLARLGAPVFCADVDEGRATATARRTRGTAVVLDVSDLDAAERAVRSAATTLHGIVHAAGISPRTAFPEVDEAEWGRVLEVNLSAPFMLTQRLLDVLADGGAIVNVTSARGRHRAGDLGHLHAVVLRRQGRVRVGDGVAGGGARPGRGIRVNAVAPGFIVTDMTARTSADTRGGSRNARRSAGGAQAAEVAAAIAFLLSDAAAFITGATLPVDGGVTLGVLRYPER